MKNINHPILIVSTASAMVIIGVSVALGLRFGVAPGLITGVGAFTLLIACMLFLNRRMNKTGEAKSKKIKGKKKKEKK